MRLLRLFIQTEFKCDRQHWDSQLLRSNSINKYQLCLENRFNYFKLPIEASKSEQYT